MGLYQADPGSKGAETLRELSILSEAEPACEEAAAFTGAIARALGQWDTAEQAFRRASKINPGQAKYSEALQDVARRKKSRRD